MKKIVRLLALSLMLISILFFLVLTFFLVIPINDISSDSFNVSIGNETGMPIVLIGLEQVNNNNYGILTSVKRPFLISILNLIPSDGSKSIKYDMWGTNDTIYFIGVNKNKDRYFEAVNLELNTSNVVFDESSLLSDTINIDVPYGICVTHIFFSAWFYLCWIVLEKYYIKIKDIKIITKFTLLFVSLVNLVYAIGYFTILLFIQILF